MSTTWEGKHPESSIASARGLADDEFFVYVVARAFERGVFHVLAQQKDGFVHLDAGGVHDGDAFAEGGNSAALKHLRGHVLRAPFVSCCYVYRHNQYV